MKRLPTGALPVKRLYLLAVLCLSAVGTSLSAKTPFWGATAPVAFDTPSDQLKNGEFTWAPEIAPTGPIVVLVSLDEQRAYTYRNGILIGEATVSTGKPGHETPTGVFTTKLKDKDHHSSKYNNAAMPYTQKITNDGVALHAGGIPGYPESHGCVHLPSEYARLLFGASPLGMTVVIADAKTQPALVDHPPFLAPINATGADDIQARLSKDEAYRWQPELQASGPVSIVASRADQRVVVLRNGVEIGRAKISFIDPGSPLGSQVFVAKAATSGDGLQWLAVPMTGHLDETGAPPDAAAAKRVRMPQDFQKQLSQAIGIGTTLVITDAPILEHTTGKEMALLSSHPDA